MRIFLLALIALASVVLMLPASAQQVVATCGAIPTTPPVGYQNQQFVFNQNGQLCTYGASTSGSTSASKHVVSSTLTKISGGGTYTGATTTVPQAICLFASVTACAPLTMAVSATATVTGNITGIMLVKSTTGSTAATFRVFVYQAAPTLTGVFNTSTYLALAADIGSGAYVGSWECTTQVINTNNGYYDCTANRPSGNNAFNLTDGTLRFVVAATGAYVSGSSETFNVIADVLTSVP